MGLFRRHSCDSNFTHFCASRYRQFGVQWAKTKTPTPHQPRVATVSLCDVRIISLAYRIGETAGTHHTVGIEPSGDNNDVSDKRGLHPHPIYMQYIPSDHPIPATTLV